jgi:N-acetylglutamate synthase-like GNAT family acetyltransferase
MPVVSFRVREAGPDDGRSIAALLAHLTGSELSGDVAGRLESLTADPDHLVLVATDAHDEVVGWVHAFVAHRVQTRPFAEIGGLVVSPAHRRIGAGLALCRRVAQWAEDLGLLQVRVRSRSDRAEAASFFEALGFSRTKIQYVFDRTRCDPDQSAP